MKVEVSMTTTEEEFTVSRWWASSPDFVVASLQRQLEAAAAIWPELADLKIEKRRARSKAYSGAKGGDARAAALTPSRRSEIASEAAKARWGKTDTGSVT